MNLETVNNIGNLLYCLSLESSHKFIFLDYSIVQTGITL